LPISFFAVVTVREQLNCSTVEVYSDTTVTLSFSPSSRIIQLYSVPLCEGVYECVEELTSLAFVSNLLYYSVVRRGHLSRVLRETECGETHAKKRKTLLLTWKLSFSSQLYVEIRALENERRSFSRHLRNGGDAPVERSLLRTRARERERERERVSERERERERETEKGKLLPNSPATSVRHDGVFGDGGNGDDEVSLLSRCASHPPIAFR